MNRIIFIAACAALLCSVAAPARAAKPKKKVRVELKTNLDSVAYAIGVLNGEGFKRNLRDVPGMKLDSTLVLHSFTDAFEGKTLLITAEEAQKVIGTHFEKIRQANNEATRARNTAYITEYKKQDGVQVTESGIAYKVLHLGDGPKPTVQDTVVVHYVGKTIEGKVFDSSIERGEPATFSLLQVIPGWTEGLCLMPKGSKYELVIPENLGYGSRGAGGTIEPYATLIFEVELLDIKPFVEPQKE